MKNSTHVICGNFGLPLPYHQFCIVKIHEGPKPKKFKLQDEIQKENFTGGKTGNDLYYRG